MRSTLSGLIASSLLLLVACGGGGGGDSTPPPAPPPAPQAQSITFANAGPVSRPLSDGTFTNVASGGAGTGTISYQSSNTAVATVNGLGAVTFLAAGSATITANKAADAAFLAASANYTLTITAPQAQTIAFATTGPVTQPLASGSYTNLATGGAGTGAITYQSSNTAVATVSNAGVVTFATPGTVTITAGKAADTNYLAATASYSLTISAAPPTTPVTSQSANSVTPGTTVTLSATSTDPQGATLTYAWDFGDGSTASGASVTHAFASEGNFSIRVTVTNSHGLSASSTAGLYVAWLPWYPPVNFVLNPRHFLGDVLFAGGNFFEPNGFPFTVSWELGDGSTATGETLAYRYASAGTYTVRVTVTNSLGRSATAQTTIEVMPVVAQPAPIDNTLQVYCAGAFCGAQSPTTYSGSGVGVWRYHNATTADATINVAIGGLSAGQSGFLVFSNGNETAAASVPVPGTALPPGGNTSMKAQSREAAAHAQIQAGNRAMLESLANKSRPTLRKAAPTARVMQAAAPTVGTTRQWRDIFGGSVVYNIEVAATCTFSTGRNGVVWRDVDQMQRGELDPVRVQMVADFLCGANGVYEKLVAMHGDVYGDAAAINTNFIQDAPGNLQDLNVVILGVPQSTPWNGYFSSSNLVTATEDPDSNHALGVVLNGWYLGITSEEDPTTRVTLAHEIKHLLNFYQRGVSRGEYHAIFLEETSAMLAEELAGAEFGHQSRTAARIGGYASSGGGTGYIEWTHPDGNSYNLGGSFGSFLHRRYGTELDTYLMNTCSDDGFPTSSYQCVNTFITSHGGVSFADEFARLGATALSGMAWTTPYGFGFRGALAGNDHLWPVSCAYSPVRPPRSLEGVYRATTHTYDHDFMDAAQTTFVRNNVVVPAGTTLMVVVNEAQK